MTPRLGVRGLTKRFPGVVALSDVDLDVEGGEIHALLGENGAGKSTLIKLVGGVHVPDSGSVEVDGDPIPFGDPLVCQMRGIQIIHQELTLVPELPVYENVFLGRELGRLFVEHSAQIRRTQALLDELGASFSPTARTGSLTVAEQQLVEIARALAAESKVLILDEPTSALPTSDVERLFTVLRGLRDRGIGVLYISHRLEEIFELTDRVTILRDGTWIDTKPTADMTRASLIQAMVGRTLEEEFPERAPQLGERILEVEHLSAPGRFDDVSFDVREGEIVGLYGLVGSGRTSTALALFGDLPFDGAVRLDGNSYRPRSVADAISNGLGYITEDRKGSGILAERSSGENISITFLHHLAKLGFVRSAEERTRIAESFRDFDVRASGPDQRAGTLSGGNQQKLLLARMLLETRRVLILDEPTRGIDVGAKAEIYALMNELTNGGLAIVMISSELPEILGLSDRVVVFREGVTQGELVTSDATSEKIAELATRESSTSDAGAA